MPFPRVFKGIPWLDRDRGDRLEPLPLDPPASSRIESNPPSNGERYLSKHVFYSKRREIFSLFRFLHLDLSRIVSVTRDFFSRREEFLI